MPQGSADPAITPFVEGWLVPLELGVLAESLPTTRRCRRLGRRAAGIETTSWSRRSIDRAQRRRRQGQHVLDLADNRAELSMQSRMQSGL